MTYIDRTLRRDCVSVLNVCICMDTGYEFGRALEGMRKKEKESRDEKEIKASAKRRR